MTFYTLLFAVGILTLIALLCGSILLIAKSKLRPNENQLVDAIDALLPQTQCAQCHYPGCRPYAEAIAKGEAINRCPPGGTATIQALAELLGREVLPLDTTTGITKPPQIAVIREQECIGCTLCLPACPVDAIVGAQGFMHTVITQYCTGCELCIAPCPVDCIAMIPFNKKS